MNLKLLHHVMFFKALSLHLSRHKTHTKGMIVISHFKLETQSANY